MNAREFRSFLKQYRTALEDMSVLADEWPCRRFVERVNGEMEALRAVSEVAESLDEVPPVRSAGPLPPVGSDAWAMAMLLQGKRVRRKTWHGAIYIRLENDGRLVNRLGSPATMGSCADNDWELYNV